MTLYGGNVMRTKIQLYYLKLRGNTKCYFNATQNQIQLWSKGELELYKSIRGGFRVVTPSDLYD